MKYTANDINVLSFAYNGDILQIYYELTGNARTRLFSKRDTISALLDTGYCSEIDFLRGEIRVPVPVVGANNPEYAWVDVEYFIRQNLDAEMAEKIVLIHLNAVTV